MSVCIHHIILVHSCVGGHLGCFHILAIVNNAAMSIRVYLDHMGLIFLVK